MRRNGIRVAERVPLSLTPNDDNLPYLRTKRERLDHSCLTWMREGGRWGPSQYSRRRPRRTAPRLGRAGLCPYPEYKITEIAPDGEVYFGCFDGLTIVCTASRTWTR